ncbi:hypothetical protein PsorP6_016967 [Peronosclerospora sorghi]|uniref:Uncharacterized protein n=1 Tax=Peronosclerospora sorghi TaxID=230839 RepID=A0ACC0WD51_9STRA|nr:hypothetical protein PsorP6_016967 [Peronosclerospora sorghi]
MDVLACLSGVTSIAAVLDPLKEPNIPEIGEMVQQLQDRVVGVQYKCNPLKCLSCAAGGGEEFVVRMLRAFWMGLRRSMDVPDKALTPVEMQLNEVLVQLSYLVLKMASTRVNHRG